MFFKKKYQGVLLIDIHDVLNDFQDFKIRQGLIYAKKYGYKLIDPNAFDTIKMFDWPVNVDEDFWKYALPQFLNGYGSKYLAAEALYKLHQEGYKIILCYQPNVLKLDEEMIKYHKKHIKHWFDRYHISYDEYIVTTNDLLEVMKKEKATLFISAHPEMIEHVATSYPTMIFTTNYNASLDGFHITRVQDWKEAYQKIKNNVQ